MFSEQAPLLESGLGGGDDEIDMHASASAMAWSNTADRRTLVHWLWETFVRPVTRWLGWR